MHLPTTKINTLAYVFSMFDFPYSVALRNGREIFVKWAPESRWLHPEVPVGWNDFLPLDEVINRYVGQDGALIIQISFQVLE